MQKSANKQLLFHDIFHLKILQRLSLCIFGKQRTTNELETAFNGRNKEKQMKKVGRMLKEDVSTHLFLYFCIFSALLPEWSLEVKTRSKSIMNYQ